jgi:hypothetical protein
MITISERGRKITLIGLSRVFGQVKENSGCARSADYRSGILPNSEFAPNTGVAFKLRERSPAARHGEQALGRLSRLFSKGCAKI